MKMIIPLELLKIFRKTWKECTGDEVLDINRGWCYQFALILHAIHGDKVKLCSTDQHVWVEFNGKHYDSEHRHGSKHPLDKGLIRSGHWYGNVKEIERYWNCYGIGGPVRWDVINRVVTEATPVVKKLVTKKSNRKVNSRLKEMHNAKI